MSLGSRLKEERNRNGFSQQELGDKLGSSRKTIVNWENDRTAADAAQLSELINENFDVWYILTGDRSASALNKEEQALMKAFNAAPNFLREAAMLVLNTAKSLT